MEIWRDIKDYNGDYQVSNKGRVKSLKLRGEKILKQSFISRYKTICLHKKGKKRTRSVHQLVAIHFLSHTPCGMKAVVNHKDFNRENNSVENLEIVTQRQNANKKHIKSSSKYVGVTWDKRNGKWKSAIRGKGKTKNIGHFTNEIDAHKAYQKELQIINKQ